MAISVADAVSEAFALKWRWNGHVARMREDNCAWQTTEWKPQHHARTQGRQYKRWSDD